MEMNKVHKLDFIGSNNVIPKSRKIGGHKDTICSNCGSKYSSSNWSKTYDKSGIWIVGSYHCNACHKYFNCDTGEFSRISEGRKIGEHKDTICSNCGSKYSSGSWCKKRDKNGSWDRKLYICTACYMNSACRSGELNPNSSTYKGMIGVQTVAKVLGDKDCIVMSEGSEFDIDSSKYGKVEVKTASYSLEYGYWVVSSIKSGLFDTLLVLCTDRKFENVIRIYIVSGEINVKTISILRNSSDYGWYEEFRINDIVQYQRAFQIVKDESQISINYVNNCQSLISNNEKGCICEEIVRIVTGSEASTDVMYDLVHEEYERIEVKGSDYRSRHKYWSVCGIESSKFDTLFIICMSDDFNEVERVYIIDSKSVFYISTIVIYKDYLIGLYERFRIMDIKLYQEVYKEVLENRGGDIN